MLGVRTPTRTPGYWNDPALTKSFELSGYWLTGDIARRDEEGRYYHLDRTVDVIDTAGGPVYSLPIEEILIADCAELVLDCSVVGVPSPAGGQQPVAAVRLQPGVQEPSPEQLLAHANSALRAASAPPLAAVIIARTPEDFPTGVTGKSLKRELRTRLAALLTGAR
jgi:acyl-coenzyme A synthetase/AMP-(fatty) acid ligase